MEWLRLTQAPGAQGMGVPHLELREPYLGEKTPTYTLLTKYL